MIEDSWGYVALTGLELCIFCTVIFFAVYLTSLTNNVQRAIYQDKAAVESLQEARLTNMYDNTQVYSQDVIALILRSRGEYTIKAKIGSSTYTYDKANAGVTNEELTVIIKSGIYNATVDKGGNGQITGFTFIKK